MMMELRPVVTETEKYSAEVINSGVTPLYCNNHPSKNIVSKLHTCNCYDDAHICTMICPKNVCFRYLSDFKLVYANTSLLNHYDYISSVGLFRDLCDIMDAESKIICFELSTIITHFMSLKVA